MNSSSSSTPALPTPDPNDPAALQAELEKLRQAEARFRARLIADFAQRDGVDRARLDRIEALERLISERDAAIHNLNMEVAALVRARATDAEARLRVDQMLHGDLEWFVHRLKATEDEARAGLLGFLRAPRGLKKGPRPAPTRAFVYYLHTSPYRLFRAASFTLRGWAWPTGGGTLTGVRIRIAGREFIGKHGLEDAQATAQHGPQAENPRPGFEIEFQLPAGRQLLSLEAQVGHTDWFSILTTPVWRLP